MTGAAIGILAFFLGVVASRLGRLTTYDVILGVCAFTAMAAIVIATLAR